MAVDPSQMVKLRKRNGLIFQGGPDLSGYDRQPPVNDPDSGIATSVDVHQAFAASSSGRTAPSGTPTTPDAAPTVEARRETPAPAVVPAQQMAPGPL
jgi:hypothetical protein